MSSQRQPHATNATITQNVQSTHLGKIVKCELKVKQVIRFSPECHKHIIYFLF